MHVGKRMHQIWKRIQQKQKPRNLREITFLKTPTVFFKEYHYERLHAENRIIKANQVVVITILQKAYIACQTIGDVLQNATGV